jgi:hypothetical protein
MTTVNLARGVHMPNLWYRLDECPKCQAKTGEKCMTQFKTRTRVRKTQHEERKFLPQYQRQFKSTPTR